MTHSRTVGWHIPHASVRNLIMGNNLRILIMALDFLQISIQTIFQKTLFFPFMFSYIESNVIESYVAKRCMYYIPFCFSYILHPTPNLQLQTRPTLTRIHPPRVTSGVVRKENTPMMREQPSTPSGGAWRPHERPWFASLGYKFTSNMFLFQEEYFKCCRVYFIPKIVLINFLV